MNKNTVLILLIFLVPIAVYFGLTREQTISQPAVAATGDEVIKFASPMCYECNELEKVIQEVLPKYKDKIVLNKVDVTKHDKYNMDLMQKYDVTLVPTTIFKNQDGKVIKRVEGTMKSEDLEKYLVELINE